MKLSKLYSNKKSIFESIEFNDGFNVVYGDIRHPERYELDTHNLGKTTLAKLLDFMFLAKRHREQFLFKHEIIFKDFIFFLEVSLADGSYLTIRRSVENNTKIFFNKHTEKHQDFSLLGDESWSHSEVTFDNAKTLLEGWLSFDILNQYPYRKIVGYLIRTQDDFSNVFKLQKDQGKHLHWKPYMADLLGFEGELATQHYSKQADVSKLKDKIKSLSFDDMENISQELSIIDNKLLLRQKELTNIKDFIDNFNFSEIDQERIESLVANIDDEIASLNLQEYSIKNNISRVEDSLATTGIKFNPKEVEKVFDEAKISFPTEITKDFEQLIAFNKAITKERKQYLEEEITELNKELNTTIEKLRELNDERATQLGFLSETVLVNKFKESNKQIASIQAEISFLEKQKENIEGIQALTKNKRILDNELEDIEEKMDTNIIEVNDNQDNILSNVRIYFNEIISKVFNKEGAITVYLNDSGNFEFDATYRDIKGNNTSEADGNTYGKFLCIAFDLAVARAYLNKRYPKFLFIDGALEVLDNRKRKLLLEVLNEYSQLGIQIIITAISSEVSGFAKNPFSEEDLIVTLHDDGQEGRLFKMPTW